MKPLRILFSMRNFWYVRLYDSVIRSLAAAGYDVHILAEKGEHNEVSREWNEAAARLTEAYPNISFSFAPRRLEDDWVDLRIMIRLGLDHLRFLEPEYHDATKLAERARIRTPDGVVSLADKPLWRTRAGRRLMAWALRTAERAMPVDPDVAARIEAHQADVILITPLLTLGSEQMDVLRTARRLGTPTALCVGSWDHLSSKALIRDHPHRVFVWNETQKREAVELHQVRPEEVVVTGAQCFDEWFDRPPSLERDAFCRKVGLDPARPFILYVCSALFEGSPNEAVFAVDEWLDKVRGNAALADAGVLFRPHPKRGFEWDQVDLPAAENVAVWPPRGAAPFDPATKADYYDSMFHAAAIVGLNTSALIEGGIVGRPVLTILLPEFRENQEGTLHFRYLLQLGLLQSARDLDAHVQQLETAVRFSEPSVLQNREFVRTFVRPHGLQQAATPIFTREVEQLASLQVRREHDPFWIPLLRRALTPLARKMSGTFAEQIARARRRQAEMEARERRIIAIHAMRAAEKLQLREERVARREAVRETRRQEKEARYREKELQARLKRERQAAEERARKEAVLAAREARRAERQRAIDEKIARRKQAELEKQQLLAQRVREKEAKMRAWHRTKQRAAFKSTLAGYFRRVLGALGSNR